MSALHVASLVVVRCMLQQHTCCSIRHLYVCGCAPTQAFESVLAGDDSWIGQALFVAAYVAATVLLAPASILTLAAGALYGPLKGTLLVSAASTLGAAIAFLVSRCVAQWPSSDSPPLSFVEPEGCITAGRCVG